MRKYATAIMNIVNQSCEHLTVENIFFEMKKEFPGIVLASVYNNLNMLMQQGAIRKVSIDGQPDRYDKIKKHDHLVCRTCGKIADFTFGDLTENLVGQLHSSIFDYDLKVFYECPECKSKTDKKQKE